MPILRRNGVSSPPRLAAKWSQKVPGDFALAMTLVTYRLQEGLMREARVGIGGVEARPRRVSDAEAVLEGKPPAAETFRAAAEAAADVVKPIEDLITSAAYRRDLVRALTRRALEQAAA